MYAIRSYYAGKIARQATGSVIVSYAGTKVHCAAVAASTMKDGIDFFPLTVNSYNFV